MFGKLFYVNRDSHVTNIDFSGISIKLQNTTLHNYLNFLVAVSVCVHVYMYMYIYSVDYIMMII